MSYIFAFIFLISIFCGILTGKTEEITNSIISESVNAVEIGITLAGGMAFWGGIMKIAEKSGYVNIVARLFKPIIKKLFKDLDENGKAMKAIVMNIVANLLGLGNASTPLGIEAVKRISQEESSANKVTKNMSTFIILNTSCLQILPINIATLRLKFGSQAPFEILPCIIITSLVALVFGLVTVHLFYRLDYTKKR